MPWSAEVLIDRAWIVEPGVEDGGCAAALGNGQLEAGDGEGEIPADFLFVGFGEEADQGFFPELGLMGAVAGYALEGVGGAADDCWIFFEEAVDELGEFARLSFD
jgi:hypothetical protein